MEPRGSGLYFACLPPFRALAPLCFRPEHGAAALVAAAVTMSLPAVAALRRAALLLRRECLATADRAGTVRHRFRDDVDALQVRAVAHHDKAWKRHGNLLF